MSEDNVSQKILLKIIQGIYVHELSTNEHIKNRAGVFIGFLGVFLGMVISNIRAFAQLNLNGIDTLFFIFLGIALIFLVISIFYFISVIGIGKYPRFGLDIFSDVNYSKYILCTETELLDASINVYKQMCPLCVEINRKIAKNFQNGTWSVFVSFSAFFLAIVIFMFYQFSKGGI